MDKNFWERVNVQNISEFFLHGVERVENDPSTYPERQSKYDSDFNKSLHEYRRMILETNWEGLTEEEKLDKDADLYGDAEITFLYQDAINLAFEIGLICGMKLTNEMDKAVNDIFK